MNRAMKKKCIFTNEDYKLRLENAILRSRTDVPVANEIGALWMGFIGWLAQTRITLEFTMARLFWQVPGCDHHLKEAGSKDRKK